MSDETSNTTVQLQILRLEDLTPEEIRADGHFGPPTHRIKVELVGTNESWPCTVCGERGDVVAQGSMGQRDILVCVACLKPEVNIDAGLESHARELEKHAEWLRSLIGLLDVPTYKEWWDRVDKLGKEWDAMMDEDRNIREARNAGPRLMTDNQQLEAATA